MGSPQLEAALVGRLRKNQVRIPPYPAVATRLKKLATGSHVSLGQLSIVLSSDPALAGMVIARATSASYASSPISTLTGAIQRLGIEELIGLAMAADLGRAAVSPGPLSPLRRDAWRCALLSARLAQELAPARGLSGDEGYLAGLLHDFGSVVVIATLEDIAREMPLPPLPPPAWDAMIGKLHVEFGLITAVRWGLPEWLVDVIEHHHEPTTPMGQLIHLVDEIIGALDAAPADGVSALQGVHELTLEERMRIGAVMPQVVEQMASFAPPTTQFVPHVLPAIEGETAWPIDITIETKLGRYKATAMSPSSITFQGPVSLALNWLTELEINGKKVLANVRRCDKLKNGMFAITAQPFALAGDVKTVWMALVEQTRHVELPPQAMAAGAG